MNLVSYAPIMGGLLALFIGGFILYVKPPQKTAPKTKPEEAESSNVDDVLTDMAKKDAEN